MAQREARLPKGVSVEDMARKSMDRKPEPPAGTKKLSQEELRALVVKESLAVQMPLDNMPQLQIDTESQMTLPVLEINLYGRNPRKSRNEDYDLIKESIRATKRLTSPLVVTRRPGEEKYMVGKGGNTRLAILQELFTETNDPDFQYTVVTYTPWKSESATLADHLVENELRSPMCFWDKANAYAQMKGLIEQETGTALSGRAFEQALKERGLPVGKTTLSYYAFAVGNLGAIGEARNALTGVKVYALQPAFNAHERLLTYLVQESTWPEIRDQVLRSTEQSWLATSELEPAKIIEHLDQAVALKLGEAVEFIQVARDLCQRYPNEDVNGLIAQARLQMRPVAQTEPEPPSSNPGAGTSSSQGTRQNTQKPSLSAGSGKQDRDLDLLKRAQDLATSIARLNDVADCLYILDAWPTGFYMDIPENDDPIYLVEETGPARYQGWWMLASLSEQLDGSWSMLMPESSTWRQAQRQENGRDDLALQHYMETILGMPIDPLTLGRWLATSPAANDWLELVHTLRDLRAAAPQRFTTGDDQ